MRSLGRHGLSATSHLGRAGVLAVATARAVVRPWEWYRQAVVQAKSIGIDSLPLVLFADMQPEGIGVMTAYIVPSLVVLFFFVLMLDALMNRVFMIEQPPEVQAIKRMRMRLDLAAGLALLVIWGTYFRTLLQI